MTSAGKLDVIKGFFGTQKENWAKHAFFRDNKATAILKISLKYITMYDISFSNRSLIAFEKYEVSPNFLFASQQTSQRSAFPA